MAEQPPLNRSYVISYAANDKDYPVIGIRLDPRVAGYRVPDDLSPHPDSKRYPNHIFTGSQPSNGDERVTHTYEILPSPWVPFTRYDDDLGPIQGRRRAVKNESQQADLTSSTKISYEGREGSAIVSNEIEETWSIKTDEDGNSLFPLKDRDFYDASRGAVQERRQLFVPTGEEEGTLENVNGVITQTSYEPYNEFLSVKIVQTYKVDGPQLIGQATDNDGQLVTVTTQRKGADGYVPPSPSATRTVEVNREDAESLIERIVDTPEIFTAKTFSVERPDPIPQKFRVAVPLETDQEIVAGSAEVPVLQDGDISRSEEQRNKFLKRVSSTSRDQTVLPQTLLQKATDSDKQEVTITETLQVGNTSEEPSATITIESEALGDGNYVIRKTEVPEVFAGKTFQKTKDDLTPQKFRGAQESDTTDETVAGIAEAPVLASGEFAKSEQQINKFVKRVSTTSRAITLAVTLNEKILTPEGLIGTRVLTLNSGDQTFTPSATLVDASVEALGDGRTVKTETTIPKIFDGKSIRKTKVDLTPEKFKARQSETTTEQNFVGQLSETISLGSGEFSKTEQQVTEFVKRVSTTSRDITLSSTFQEFVITPQGQLATRTIRMSGGTQSLAARATLIDGSIEAIGDGRTIKTEIVVPSVFNEKQQTRQKPDVVPTEFRASVPDFTESIVREGKDAVVGALSSDEISKSVQRITQDKIRETKTIRSVASYPALTESIVDNDGLIITRTKTVSNKSQTIIPSALVTGSVQALGDGLTLKTEDKKLKVFESKLFSTEKTDTVPTEFRAENPAITEEFNEAGIAEQVVLEPNEISKSEQQVTEFVKRVRKTTREITEEASLEGEQIDEDGVKVSVVRSLANGTQSINPSATVRGQVEAIGDGKTIKTQLTRNEVFGGEVFATEKPDIIPAAFQAEKPSVVNEITIVGNAENPSLEGDEISKSEQQITKFLKRVRTTRRDNVGTVTLKGEEINEAGQKVNVTRTLSKSAQSIAPSATRSGNVQALGDGYTVKTEQEIPAVFDQKSITVAKPDTIPEKFRVNLPQKRKEEIIPQEQVDELNLETNEYTKTEQRLTEFTVQKTTVERESSYEAIQSSDLEETWGIGIPYTESIVDEFGDEENCEYDGLGDNKYIKRLYDIEQLSEKLDGFSATTPTTINLNLPKILKEVTCVVEKSDSVSEERNSIPYVLGRFGNLSFEDAGSFTSTVSFIPRFDVVLEEIWANDIEATLHIFFLKSDQLTTEEISSKCGAEGFWPSLNPSSFSTVVFGKSESKTYAVSVNRFYGVSPDGFIQRQNLKTKYENSVIPVNLNIPNCIVEEEIEIEEQEDYNYSDTITISFPAISNPSFTIPSGSENVPFSHDVEFEAKVTIKKNGEIPRSGKYVINSSAEPYKFGYFIVRAVTFDAAKLERD
jgi:hypothetical protein